MSSAKELTEAELEVVAELPSDIHDLADSCDVSEATIRSRIMRVREKHGSDAIVYHRDDGQYRAAVDFDVEQEEQELEQESLNDREEYVLKSLPATRDELSEDLGISDIAVEAHISSIRQKGYEVDYDERTETYHSNESPHLRSSEHIGQRTKAANEWWQLRHDELVREFRALEKPDVDLSYEPGNQDVVSHLTDLHMGDLILSDSGEKVYGTEITKEVIDYITRKQLELYELQSQLIDIDTWHELWGGDFLTNEAIYQGQWEDLDAFLDEQHDEIVDPILQRLKAISDKADTVNIVCKVGNHGEHRASGNSKQANADLVFYKHIRNNIASIQKYGDEDAFDNVNFQIGTAQPYKNFTLRGGKLNGHLRHGQYRKAGFRTSAAQKEWLQTYVDHEFDLAYMGHVHRGQRFHVDGKPVFVTGSPKPSGEFAEQIAAGDDTNIALFHGVSDDGLTFTYPIDLRDFEPISK